MKNLKKLTVLALASLVLAGCGGNNPSSQAPSSQAPSSAAPSSAAPSSQAPSSQAPSSEPASSQAPSSQEPSSQAPTSVIPSFQPDPHYVPPVKPTTYEAMDEDEVFEGALGGYDELVAEAHAAKDANLSYVLYARAEAKLLDSGVMAISSTNGGNYAMTRIAARTVPYVLFGNDSDRYEHTVIVKGNSTNNFITKEQRASLIEAWEEGRTGGAPYDPATLLKGWGFEIDDHYNLTFNADIETLDMLDTSAQADSEVICQGLEGLYKYDCYGFRQPAMAVGEPVISADGLTYTFTIRDDAYWYTNDGRQYAKVKADDFVAGFNHMLDGESGLQYLVENIAGVNEYLAEGEDEQDFAAMVGYKALDDTHLEVKLVNPEGYFLTRLNYSVFMPMNREFFRSQGGVFGPDALAQAKEGENYKYGLTTDISSILYNSAYVASSVISEKTMTYVANENYYDADKVTTKTITWVYDDGRAPLMTYSSAVGGFYTAIGLGEASGILAQAKADGNFEKYAYVTDTDATTFFGGWNLDRQAFQISNGNVASDKTEQQKIDARYAIQNANFRRALQHAWDRITWNALSVGEELAAFSLRNSYTPPEYVVLADDVEYEGELFGAGTSYGELVEHFLAKDYNLNINLDDGQDGWYDPYLARAYLDLAKAEMGANWAPVKLELLNYSGSVGMTARAAAFKKSIEDVLGVENVEIVILNGDTLADYYAAGYRASSGKTGDFDLFYGSGWGPDYGDPSTYLDTMVSGIGYMTKVIGLY